MYIEVSDIKNAPNQSLSVNFNKIIKKLDDKNPIKARLEFKMIGQSIIASGEISGIIKSTCERCLKEFNRKIDIDVDERFILGTLFGGQDGEIELKSNDFVEELGDKNKIDVEDLIYQSVILKSPNQIVCDINCNGNENFQRYVKKEKTDPRLEIFKTIKIKDSKEKPQK